MEIEAYITNLVSKSAVAIPNESGDYYVNGILYCGKCRTPKQTVIKMPWGEIKPNVLCKCKQEEQEHIESERKAQEFAEMVLRNKKTCYSLAEYKNMGEKTFANAEKSRVITIAQRYVEQFPVMLKAGRGLTFFGNTGGGKSYAAVCICNALLDKGYRCMFTNFSRIRNEMSGLWEERQSYMDSLNRYSLLVFDDLGAEAKTEYMQEVVHSVIDARLRAKLPTIVTTNLSAAQLSDDADISQARIYSRLFEMTVPVEVKHADRRKEKIEQDCKKFAEMLGI